jgi:hypothetical protein
MTAEYDHLLKLVLVGDASVGKSSLLLRFVDGVFDTDLPATIGVDFKARGHAAERSAGRCCPSAERAVLQQRQRCAGGTARRLAWLARRCRCRQRRRHRGSHSRQSLFPASPCRSPPPARPRS